MNSEKIKQLATYLRFLSLKMSTKAGSGHPTSSLSAADLMATFLASRYRYDIKDPQNPNNDRLIFSKGHASPLYYALFTAMGAIKLKELDNYRTFDSILEGHPTPRFPHAEAATGSLGQGLSIGFGEALNAKFLDKVPYRTYVLLGDGEMAEGSTWEAIELASFYKMDNLIAILDVNRLGQSDQTMIGHDVLTYRNRLKAFGWATMVIDGHNIDEILSAFKAIDTVKDQPYMIIAKTLKGKGVSFIQDTNGWHGKPLDLESFDKAVKELGPVDLNLKVTPKMPVTMGKSQNAKRNAKLQNSFPHYKLGDKVATRKTYGDALARLGELYPDVVALDGDVKNSTYSEIFKKKYPHRFFEMYIAEQNMVGAAIGLARRGKVPFVSTFAAFLTRAFDQIRMGAISQANIKICGSHAGVSIGEDGPSQMALEDISMFRSVFGCSVLYPADAVSTEKLVEAMINDPHMAYMRTTRPATEVLYGNDEKFPIGGSKVHRLESQNLKLKAQNQNSKLKSAKKVIIAAAGITLYESLKAQEELAKEGIEAIVVDCYSVKPIDGNTLRKLSKEAKLIVTVEDHWYEGGLGDAVLNEFGDRHDVRIEKLAVCKMPRSGKPQELVDWEGISSMSIVATIRKLL